MTGTFGTTPDRSRHEGIASTPTQTSFIDDLRGGERDAFLLLYELYRTPIYNLVVQLMGNETDAENLTPRVFIRAYHRILTHDGELFLKPLIYRAAVTTCLDHLDCEADQRGALPSADREVAHVWRSRRREQNDLFRRFSEALQALPGRHRAALLLKDVHDLRLDEVASILGMSMSTAEALLFRTREAFRHAFEELSGGPHAARCRLAEQAVAGAGRALSRDEERKLREHAEYCPDCHATVAFWGSGKISLATFLKNAPLPAALDSAPVFRTPVGSGRPATAAAPATAGEPTIASGPAIASGPVVVSVPAIADGPDTAATPVVARGVPLKLADGREATADAAAAVTSGTLVRPADRRRSAAAAARHVSIALARAGDSLLGRVAVLAVVLTCVGAYVGLTTYVSQHSAGQGDYQSAPTAVHLTLNPPRVSSAAQPGSKPGKPAATTPRASAGTSSGTTAVSGQTAYATTTSGGAASRQGAPAADGSQPPATGSDGVQTAGWHDASHTTVGAAGSSSGGVATGRVGATHGGGGHAGGKPGSDGGSGSGGAGSGSHLKSWWKTSHSADRPAQHEPTARPAPTNGETSGHSAARPAKQHAQATQPARTNGEASGHSAARPATPREQSARPVQTTGQTTGNRAQTQYSQPRFNQQQPGQFHHEGQQPLHDGGQGRHGSAQQSAQAGGQGHHGSSQQSAHDGAQDQHSSTHDWSAGSDQ